MIERGYLYCVTCLPTGKLYFGQTTVNVKRRWHQHIRFAVQSRDDYNFTLPFENTELKTSQSKK